MNLADGHTLEGLILIALGLWLVTHGASPAPARTDMLGQAEAVATHRHWAWRAAGLAVAAIGLLVLGGVLP